MVNKHFIGQLNDKYSLLLQDEDTPESKIVIYENPENYLSVQKGKSIELEYQGICYCATKENKAYTYNKKFKDGLSLDFNFNIDSNGILQDFCFNLMDSNHDYERIYTVRRIEQITASTSSIQDTTMVLKSLFNRVIYSEEISREISVILSDIIMYVKDILLGASQDVMPSSHLKTMIEERINYYKNLCKDKSANPVFKDINDTIVSLTSTQKTL